MAEQKAYRMTLLTFFPLTYWIILFVGVFLFQYDRDFRGLSTFLINNSCLLLFLRLGVILHEFGHLYFAKLAGGNPRRVIFGVGHEITRYQYKTIKIIINQKFNIGLALAAFPEIESIRLRYALYIFGGPITNFLLCLIPYLFFGFDLGFIIGENGIDLPSSFVFANLLLTIISLFPYYIKRYGLKLPSDGLNLLKLPFYNERKIIEMIQANTLLDAQDFFEGKKYDQALLLYQNYLETNPQQFSGAKMNLAIAHLKKGEYDIALSVLREIENCMDPDIIKSIKSNKVYLFNSIAWIFLLKNEIDLADSYSERAMKANANISPVQGTRGSVLIEKFHIDEGIALLKRNFHFDYVNSNTLGASIYLMLAYFYKGNSSLQTKHEEFLIRNLDSMDIDEKYLFERNLKKINAFKF